MYLIESEDGHVVSAMGAYGEAIGIGMAEANDAGFVVDTGLVLLVLDM